MCRKLFVISFAALQIWASSAFATTIYWNNAGGDRLWHNPANWSGGACPSITDKGAVRNSAVLGPIINSSDTIAVYQIVVGDATSTHDTLDMTGGSLSTSGSPSPWFIVGYGTGNNGTFTLSDGTVTVGNNFYIGNNGTGTLNMSGSSSITVAVTFGIGQGSGAGTVNLQDGVINANGTFHMGSNGRLNITDGKLIVNGDARSTIQPYIDDGWITVSTGLVCMDYDITNPGKTTVQAAPSSLPGQATNPSPANFATGVGFTPLLSWTADSNALSHDVYFGTTSPGTFQGNQTATTFDPGTLTPSTTYFWRIDEVNGPNTITGMVWSFTTASVKATNPSPGNNATGVSVTTASLTWSAGLGATSHDVYFGSSNPPAFKGNQTANTYTPGLLLYNTVYYWRIDEQNTGGTVTGDVWSFATAAAAAGDRDWINTSGDRLWKNSANWNGGTPTSADKAAIRNSAISGPIIDSSTTAVANEVVVGDSASTADSLDMTGGTLTTSGLNCWFILGYNAVNSGTFNISGGTVNIGDNLFVGYNGTGTINMTGGSITDTVTFGIAQMTGSTGTVNLHGGTITANGTLNIGSGGRMDITTGTLILAGDQRTLMSGYISSGLITAYSGGGTVNVDYGNLNPGKTTVTATGSVYKARNPSPAFGATNVSPNVVLGWAAGLGAASHDVYFGDDSADVTDVNRLPGDLNGNGVVDWCDLKILAQYWLLDPIGTNPYAGVNTDSTVDFIDYSVLSQDWMNSANPVFKGNQTALNFTPGTLALNTIYYWRVDEVNGPNTVKSNVWSFTTETGKALNPSPANNATNVDPNALLSWTPGFGATSHNVYFGVTNPPALIDTVTDPNFNPDTLTMGETYFWRVDEVSPYGTITGDLWTFTVQTPPLPANLRKGPYLIYPGDNTQMTVHYQLTDTSSATLDWGTDTSYSTGTAATTEYGTDHQHKYTITGLTPGTKYYYRVTLSTGTVRGSFTAAPAATATDLKFLMYGDTRTWPAQNDLNCSKMVATWTADPAYQTFCLLSGDWVESDNETTWTNQWFTNNSTTTNLYANMRNVAYGGPIGNHEGSANVFKKYWQLPFPSSRFYYSFDYGPVHVAVLDQYTTYTSGSAQYNWLVNDLSTTTKHWKIIALHEPGWSCPQGHGNNTTVQSVIQPLCTQYGVQIVVGGHNHYFARALVNGVHHITSGAGGADAGLVPTPGTNVVVCAGGLSFQKVEISGATLTCTTIRPDGSVLDLFTVSMPSDKATNPTPENNSTNVATSSTLSWTSGTSATSHNIYFGTANPPPFVINQTSTSYNPGTLANSTTYHWRIDEVGGSGTITGDVWSFTTAGATLVYPYLTWRNDPTNSVMVNWWNPDTQGNATVDYGTTSSYGSTATVSTIANIHHVELTGLSAGTTYHYRIRSSDGTIGPDNTYTVPVASPTSFNFAAYGDPRGTDTSNEPYYTRHRALCNWILAQNYDFILELGDTVWDGQTISWWPAFFEIEHNLSQSKVIMAAVGNHELGTNYNNFYSAALPTNGLAGSNGNVYSFNYGNAHFVSLTGWNVDKAAQGSWLAADLAAASANPNIKWIFALMHKPLYTDGGQAPDTADLVYWGPLFDQYHVDIAFAGHNHRYERSYPINGGVVVPDGQGTVYVTNGMGGAEFNSGTKPANFVCLFGTNLNKTVVVSVTVTGNQLSLQAITNEDGGIIDSFTLVK